MRTPIPLVATEATVKRFWSKVDKSSDGCWVWLAGKSRNGYGSFSINAVHLKAHRVSWAWANDKQPPEGLDLDHLCRNRACVNPDHLEPVTRKENIARGDAVGATAARTGHCIAGHDLAAEGARSKSGDCRLCLNRRWRDYYARRRSA